MYTSLDRVDIVTKPRQGGRESYVLTDHRSAAEVETEPELSVLFAMTRVMAAAAMADLKGGAEVVYACAASPPACLLEAVTSAGGRLTVGTQMVAPHASPREAGDIADAAFRSLAERLRQRQGGILDEPLLQGLEDATLAHPLRQGEDEPDYWTRLHELAAVCGELLRAKMGGRWQAAADRASLLPFGFVAGAATVNVADKAQRFLDYGESQRPSQLLRLAEDLGREAGPLMVNLKPGDFPRDRGVWRELLKGPGPGGAALPVAFLGNDQPHSFAYLPADTARTEDRFDEALRNLARIEIPVREHEIAGVKVLAVADHFYASEKILDQPFLRALQHQLDTPLLAAAIPSKGVLLVTAEVAPPAVSKFALLAEMQHRKSAEGQALSPVVFLVSDGKIVGYLGAGARPAETAPRKAGLWRRLFRGH